MISISRTKLIESVIIKIFTKITQPTFQEIGLIRHEIFIVGGRANLMLINENKTIGPNYKVNSS